MNSVVQSLQATPASARPALPEARRSAILFLIGVLLATAISLASTGFTFGMGNNVFSVPIVLRLPQQEPFAGDAFYRSLTNFTSVVWPFIRVVATDENVRALYAIAHVASRLAAFAALALVLSANGPARVMDRVLALVCLAATPWLVGVSVVGMHGLFIDTFTHSELTWGPLLGALLAVQRRRLVLAAALVAITFAINAFIGVWLLVITVAASLSFGPRQFSLKTWLASAMVFAGLAGPVVAWIASVMAHAAAGPSFSFIGYIRTYFPNHFLIEAASPEALVTLVLLAACGFIAAQLMDQRKFWLVVLGSAVALVLIGIPLPYWLDHRVVFNLHLLRADGLIQLLSVLLTVGVASRAMASDGDRRVRALGALCLLTVVTSLGQAVDALVMASAVLGLWVSSRLGGAHRGVTACVALVLSLLCIQLVGSHLSVRAIVRLISGALVVAIGRSTLPERRLSTVHGVMLVAASALVLASTVRWRIANEALTAGRAAAVEDIASQLRRTDVVGTVLVPVTHEFDTFQLQSRRSVWVDWKQGAAVMWQPGFFPQWSQRIAAVKRLESVEAFIEYARTNGTPWVVVPRSASGCTEHGVPLRQNAAYIICRVEPLGR